MDATDANPSPVPPSGVDKRVDLVLEGGGVKGIALVGALEVLEERGYRFNRVAGSSAGAIAGSMVAAGIPATKIAEIMRSVDYRKFADGGPLTRFLPVKAVSLLASKGIYRGRFLADWLEEQLTKHSPRYNLGTFADLAYEDPEKARSLPESRAFNLVVTASDLSNGRLRFLPWDFQHFNRPAGEQRIVDAVRVSMSIPFFYRPVTWTEQDGHKTWLVDGGMLSNFPITVFDAPANARPRWPTLGIKLSSRPGAAVEVANRVAGPLSFGVALLRTMMGFHDGMHIDSADAVARTIFVDTGQVRTTQFDLSEADREMLYDNGRSAATKFLDGTDERAGWDFDRYITEHRPIEP
jgi:NTE family protein